MVEPVNKLIPSNPRAGAQAPVSMSIPYAFAFAHLAICYVKRIEMFDRGLSHHAAQWLTRERQALSDAIGWASRD